MLVVTQMKLNVEAIQKQVIGTMGMAELQSLFEEAEAAGDDITCFAVLDECRRRTAVCAPTSLPERSLTSTPIPNQTVSRHCPVSVATCVAKQYVVLRYAPQELHMVNPNTTNKKEEDQTWKRKH